MKEKNLLRDSADAHDCAHHHSLDVPATLKVFLLTDSSGEVKVKSTAEALREAISFEECF